MSQKLHQGNLDFDSQQRERWAAIRSLALPKCCRSIRARYLIETIEGMGGGRLRCNLNDISDRLSFPKSTLRLTIKYAESQGLIKVTRGRRDDGTFDHVILENDIGGMITFNRKANQKQSIAAPTIPIAKHEEPTVGELLQKAGIATWRNLSADLESRKIGADHVAELIDHWYSNRDMWERPEGVLCSRLKNAAATIKADKGWPPRSRQESPSRETSQALDEFGQYRTDVDRERLERDRRERDFGARLDAMSEVDLLALAATCMDLENEFHGRLMRKYIASRVPGVVRDKLLSQLSGRESCSTSRG